MVIVPADGGYSMLIKAETQKQKTDKLKTLLMNFKKTAIRPEQMTAAR